MNIKSGKAQVTVSEALKEFYGKEISAKQQILNKIFPNPLSGHKVKPHPSLLQGGTNLTAVGGFGL